VTSALDRCERYALRRCRLTPGEAPPLPVGFEATVAQALKCLNVKMDLRDIGWDGAD
jgi:hypothetical protein